MRRPDGITLLAIYHFIIGIPLLIGACAILVFAVPAVTVNNNDPNGVIAALFGLGVGLLFVGGGGLLALIAGAGLLALKEWARWLALALAILSLPVFPIGTITGGVTIWYLLQEHIRAAFYGGETAAPPGYHPTPPASQTPAMPVSTETGAQANQLPEKPPFGMEAEEAGMDRSEMEGESDRIEYPAPDTAINDTTPEPWETSESSEAQPVKETETPEQDSADFSSMETSAANFPEGEVIPSAPPGINSTIEDNIVEQDESRFASAEVAADENESGMTEWRTAGARIYDTPVSETNDVDMETPKQKEGEEPSEGEEETN